MYYIRAHPSTEIEFGIVPSTSKSGRAYKQPVKLVNPGGASSKLVCYISASNPQVFFLFFFYLFLFLHFYFLFLLMFYIILVLGTITRKGSLSQCRSSLHFTSTQFLTYNVGLVRSTKEKRR